MTSHSKTRIRQITAFVGSRAFFTGLLAFFVLEAAWIALSGRYPMAFDEDFHLGVIRLYAHHISPFWSSQPAGADHFGAVIRDPSYLYHYLMSFPYRLISVFAPSQATQVLLLRFINIGLFAACLPLYRRLLIKTGASRALVHSCLAFFILIPIAPLLAAQINYDNLLLPLTAATLLLAVNFSEELRKYKRTNVKTLLWLLIAGCLTCLVKYAFLPIFLIVLAFIAVCLKLNYSSWRKFGLSVGFGFTLITRRARWLLIILFLVAAGLFLQRYGVNAARYHKPVPECSEVLSVQQCSEYPPWNRDYVLAQTKHDSSGTDSPLVFTADWFYGMWLRSFFAVDGPATDFQTRGPLIIPAVSAILFVSAAALATLAYAPRLLRAYNKQVLWLFVAVLVTYAGSLWIDGYQSFLQVGQAVAINGRYLLPVMPLLLLLLSLGANELLRDRQAAKISVAAVALLCMLWGGGTLTYILRSNDAWYWHSQPVYDANHAVQRSLGPITPGYYSPNEFMERN